MVRRQAWPSFIFCLGVVSYLFVDWMPLEANWVFLVLLAPTFVNPFFFWLFSKSLFDDDFRYRKWIGWTAMAIVVFFYLTFFILVWDFLELPDSVKMAISTFRYGVSLLFVALGISEATRNREADLVLSRIKFRSAFIFLTAILIGMTVLTEIAFGPEEIPAWIDLVQKSVIFGLVFFFAVRSLNFRSGFFEEEKEAEVIPPKKKVDNELVRQLLDLIEGEKFYRTEGLTIRRLAEEMNVKEYKLRQTINQHLGFRNFNDFLNSYRIAEACELLKDSSKKEMTVLEIAFQLGYNSLAPFNKAFKAQTGVTPTEWRRQHTMNNE